MSDLRKSAVAAHGGLLHAEIGFGRSRQMAIHRGDLEAKLACRPPGRVTYEGQIHEERVIVDRFAGANRRLPLPAEPPDTGIL